MHSTMPELFSWHVRWKSQTRVPRAEMQVRLEQSKKSNVSFLSVFVFETFRIFTDARGCWHVGGIRPMVSLDTALVGILPLHAMPWPFALHVSCRMHPPVLHSTCSRLRRTCHAPLLVIGPRYASRVAGFLPYDTQSAYLKVSS